MTKTIDWNSERNRFPACSKYAYLMNAANAPLSNEVYQAEREVLDTLHFDAHTSWEGTVQKMNNARRMLAELAGGEASDWGFGFNTGYNMNLLAIGMKNKDGVGDIISCQAEFPSSTTPWAHQGYNVIKVAPEENGLIDPEKLLGQITKDTKALVLSHVQFSSGFRSNIKFIGQELHKRNIPFIVNATQSLGVFPINVDDYHITALTCSVHKWLGAAYGCSLLFTQKEWRKKYGWAMGSTMSYNDPTFSGSLDEPRQDTGFMELGALPFNQIMGVEASLKEILRIGIDNISQRILSLTSYLEEKALAKGVSLAFNRPGDNRSGITFLKVDNPSELEVKLIEKKVLVNERRGNLRVAIHYFNNKEDIDRLLDCL